jgi:ABC-type transport system involved in cytochrome c biogenesis permease subunit
MFEILLSNLFSLGLVLAVACWLYPLVRPALLVASSVLLLLGAWSLLVSPAAGHLPATYDNNWLWVHVVMGKVFLGTCLVSTGLAGVLLLRRIGIFDRLFSELPDSMVLDVLAWRFVAIAFVFESLMLIAGAVWAQDAWGRYWDWDPLETWSFITWLTLAIVLHVRVTWHVPPSWGWVMILAVFTLAFLTFFGVPFVSVSPHKGAV